MALVQLGGAQTLCSLQLAPGEQSLLPLQWLPTGTQLALMQLLPASQSPEREHWGRRTHSLAMQDAPALQSESCEHCVSTCPEQAATRTSARRTPETAEEMRTEDGRSCTCTVCRAFDCSGIR